MTDMVCKAGAPAESSLPPSGGIRGDLPSPHTAFGASEFVNRVVRVPLERPDDAEWRDLVDLAREAAAFANGVIAGWWAEAHGWRHADETTFVAFKGRLSGDVRAAVSAEAKGAWQKVRTRVLRRDQRVPAFASDRALVVRGRYAGGKGGVRIERDGAGITVRLLLRGKDHGGWQAFAVWPAALTKDKYLAGLLDKLASGEWRCSKVALQIDLRRRKLYALCAYARPAPAARAGGGATLGPLEADGSLWLRAARTGRDFTREAGFIRSRKEHYDGIVKRFRRSVGRGPRWRQVYRRNLPPTYGEWATAKLHQLSAAMIAWCVAHRVARLTVLPLGDGDWPAHQLETMLRYKGEDAGIAVTTAATLEEEPTQRAALAPVRKAQKQAGRARKAAKVLADAIDHPRSV